MGDRPASTKDDRAQPTKVRLDVLMVERGLAETRNKAQAQILAGEVVVGEHRVDKPGTRVWSDVKVRLKNDVLPYVGRGAFKLAHALDAWPGPVKDAVCVDVGASTGGFTEVLLERGAKEVYAIDVGHGQLHSKLVQDPRVNNLERTHFVKLEVGALPDTVRCWVIDVSFISIKTILTALTPHAHGPTWVWALIKPQFEVGREALGKNGIVQSENARDRAVQDVLQHARDLGFTVVGVEESPIKGTKGNVEYVCGLSARVS